MKLFQILKWTIAAALCGGSTVASATMATYDFTGFYEIPRTGTSDPVGVSLSGSFTIDYDAAIPGQGFGTFNDPTGASWAVASNGLPSATVFSETLTIGGTTVVSSNPLSAFRNDSQIIGGNHFFGGGVTIYSDANDFIRLGIGTDSFPVNYLSNGLPDFTGVPLDIQYEARSNNGTRDDSFFGTGSVIPTPLPAAAWLLISGLGALGVFRANGLRARAG